jgi:hypothetical protein
MSWPFIRSPSARCSFERLSEDYISRFQQALKAEWGDKVLEKGLGNRS